MANPDFSYASDKRLGDAGVQYVFVSKGERDIIKVVEYSFVQPFLQRQLFNLGFGDYDAANDQLLDAPISNNGDHYKILNTVLNTIPDFFTHYPTDIVAVQGSDSHPDFPEQCRGTCEKNCAEGECRNAHRRISIYRRYIDQHYDTLTAEYNFYGGTLDDDNQLVVEDYEKGKKYSTVFVAKKMLP
jgi:hypothetical protein